MADVRVTALPAATSLAVGDVLHGVQAADSQDKQVDLQSLTAFINSQTPQSPVGGLSMDYLWSTSTSSADPGSGNVAVNNVDPYSATQLFISDTNNHGNNVESVYSNLAVGDAIGLWEQQSGRTIYYAVNGAQTDNTTWYSIPVTLLNTGATGTFSASDVIEVFAISNPDRQTPSGGTTGQYLGKASATDFDTSWQTIPATNIGHSTTSTTVPLTSSTGSGTTLPAATTSQAGVLTGADKTKLDGIASGAQVNVPTDLTYTASTRLLESSTGTDVTLPEVVAAGNSGLMTGADKTKLNGIETGAEVNDPTNLSYTASTRVIASSTGTNATLPEVVAGGDSGLMTGSDKTKLNGIESGAEVNDPTNLGYTTAASTGTVTSSTGTDATLPAATTSLAGLLTGADKTKLDGIAAGAQVNVPTNLGYTTAASTGTVTSSTGTDATLPAATTSLAGLLTGADKTKLDGIAAGAEVNVNADWDATSGDALILNKPTIPSGVTNLTYTTAASTGTVNSDTGTDATIPAATTSLAGLLTGADKTKLDGIQAGAQVNVATNLSNTPAASTVAVESSTGTNTTLPAATTSLAGVMTGADKTKLDGIATGATANTGTVTSVSGGTGLSGTVTTSGSINLADTAVTPGSYTLANVTIDQQGRITAASNGSAGSGTVTSIATSAPITGGTITTSGTIGISAATTSAAGSMSAADKTKLDGIAAGAEVNVDTDLSYTASTRVLASSTGTNATLPEVVAGGDSGLMTGADKTKLNGIATGATANTGTVTSIATSGAITGGTITTSGTITARDATTGQTGVVQLTDSTSSTSTTTAATPNSVKSANDNANGRLSTGGGTLTGGVYQTVRTISNNTAWDLSTGNLWTFAGGTIANPTNATAGMSGLIYVTAAVSGWGANFDFPGGTAVNPATFPAICPFYVSATNVIKIGTPVEGIT